LIQTKRVGTGLIHYVIACWVIAESGQWHDRV